jgi:hypothetical protein
LKLILNYPEFNFASLFAISHSIQNEAVTIPATLNHCKVSIKIFKTE